MSVLVAPIDEDCFFDHGRLFGGGEDAACPGDLVVPPHGSFRSQNTFKPDAGRDIVARNCIVQGNAGGGVFAEVQRQVIAGCVWLEAEHGKSDVPLDGKEAGLVHSVGYNHRDLLTAHLDMVLVCFTACNVPCDTTVVLDGPTRLGVRGTPQPNPERHRNKNPGYFHESPGG